MSDQEDESVRPGTPDVEPLFTSTSEETIRELKDQLDQLKAQLGAPQILIQRERKLRKFADGSGEAVESWCEDAQHALEAQGLKGKPAVNYIVQALEGPARLELKCRHIDSVEEVFAALRDVFGDKQTASQKLRKFYERRQDSGETITDFSHALITLLEFADVGKMERERMLRDHFAENVADPHLRWELRRRREECPNMSFVDLRTIALAWATGMEQDQTRRQKGRVAEQVAVPAAADSIQTVLAELCKAMEEVKAGLEDVKTRQQQTESAAAKAASRHSASTRGHAPSNTYGECWFCKESGHLKRDCEKYRAWARQRADKGN